MNFSLDKFQDAVLAYRAGVMSSVEASKQYGVPESTIRKHKTMTIDRMGSGRPSHLSREQEKYLVSLLQELESIGVRLTRETLSKIAGEYIRKVKGVDQNMSKFISNAFLIYFFMSRGT